jgi:4-amino-4-deoxy-L-arabinose transferase-like glycosyltransferase
MSGARRLLGRFGPLLFVLALCGLSAAAKLHVNAPRDGIAHGDAGYYLTLAKNLATGRGFVIDYIPDFLSGEKSIPNPANTYWMPLSAVVLAAAMALFGKTFAVAQATMIAISALAPAVAYLLGGELFGKRRVALFAACLTAVGEAFLIAPCQPQTHALILVLGGLWLICALRARRNERYLLALGALTGLMHLNRGDGVLLFPLIALLWLFPEPGVARWSVKGLAKLALAYAVVMAPLWIHNTASFGSPMPENLGRVAFLVDYTELYSLPESLTLRRFLDHGSAAILASKRYALETNLTTLAFGAVTGNERVTWRMVEPHQWALLALIWLGWPFLLSRRALPVTGLVLIQGFFFTLIFSMTGLASLRATLLPAYLAYFAATGRALDAAASWLAARSAARRALPLLLGAAALGICVWSTWTGMSQAAEKTRRGVAFIHRIEAMHNELMRKLIVPLKLRRSTLMTWDVHELHVHTELRLVMLPHEPLETIHRVALEYGVSHVLTFGKVEDHADTRPGLAEIPKRKDLFELVQGETLQGELVRVFRVLPPPG